MARTEKKTRGATRRSNGASPGRRAAGNRARNRAKTESEILAAFERVLFRDGLHATGVNAIAEEAGVNKVLIYRYFGDLKGLAFQWARAGHFWPTELDMIGHDPEAFEALSVPERIETVLVNFIDAMRDRPATVQLLIAELLTPNELAAAIQEAAAKHGEGVGVFIRPNVNDRRLMAHVWELIVLVQSVTFFWCIREQSNPKFLGMNLKDDDAWQFLKDTVASIARAYLRDAAEGQAGSGGGLEAGGRRELPGTRLGTPRASGHAANRRSASAATPSKGPRPKAPATGRRSPPPARGRAPRSGR